MDRMISELLAYCDEYGMLRPGHRVLCAVSGGADSVAMLYLLRAAARERGIEIEAAHFNHRLRGDESDADEAFVRELCGAWGVNLTVGSGDVSGYSRTHGAGIEESARELRYGFLRRTAEAAGAQEIATAHNADDNAETVLMHLLRGSGARGLSGIPPVRGNIVRPVLCFTGESLRELLAREGVRHAEDSTNTDDTYLRNRLRHTVMPLLRQIEPSFPRHVLQAGELLRRDDAYIESRAEEFLAGCADGAVDAKSLAGLEWPVASRAVRLASGRKDLSAERVRSVLRLAERGRSGTAVELAGGMKVRLEQGKISFGPAPAGGIPGVTPVTPGSTLIEGSGWRMDTALEGSLRDDRCTPLRFAVRYGPEGLAVRSRRPGDRLRLAFRGGEKSLKKLFIDAKIPAGSRETVPVLVCGDTVVGVPGFGMDERFRAKRGEKAYIITFDEV